MSFRPIHAVTLEPHAESRSDAVRSIDARVCRMPGGMLAVTYVLDADLDRLRIPPPQPPRIVDRLWQYTCFEIFIRADFEEPVARQADRSSFDSGALRSGRTHGVERRPSAYHEFNFSPSGEWAVYAFERYREGAPLMEEPPDPRVMVRSAAGKLELNASLRLDALSPMHAHAKLSLGLSAVVEDRDGSLSYWALAHPAGKPDFHHPDAFALELFECSTRRTCD